MTQVYHIFWFGRISVYYSHMTKRTNYQSNRQSVSAQVTGSKQRTTYVMFGIIIVALILLIGWFLYVLIVPDKPSPTKDTSNQNNTNLTTESTKLETENTNTKKKKKNKNTNAAGLVEPDANSNINVEDNDTTDNDSESDVNDDAEGDTEGDTDTSEDAANENATTITLYFPQSDSGCGEVFPVERDVELSEDTYGDIILTMMAGPNDEESAYVDGVPGTVRLRQVEYTADGPLVTVSEGYNELDNCAQQTVDAAFIQTANAMFELSVDGPGTVEVGEVKTEDSATDESTVDDSDSNNTNNNTNSDSLDEYTY